MNAVVKFRATCDQCGKRQPRATTAWTVANWMRRHELDEHGDEGDEVAEGERE